MKKVIILLTLLVIAGCASERQQWYNRLYAVDRGRISDSTIWALSADTNLVRDIEQLDAQERAAAQDRVEKMRTADSLAVYYRANK